MKYLLQYFSVKKAITDQDLAGEETDQTEYYLSCSLHGALTEDCESLLAPRGHGNHQDCQARKIIWFLKHLL